MAVARPFRALMVLAGLLWCFFVYQIFKPSPSLHGPGERYQNFERDPNLDRESAKQPQPQRHPHRLMWYDI
jgi:mannosyltransferase